ncbi:Cupredoxin superfamily protein [Euphorbia peplus]|nr:Cupredoxin superfamily protein [Euphorbia peplus]
MTRGRAMVVSIIGAVIWLVTWGVANAKVEHLVGGDRGWDPSNSDLTSWSSSRIFTIGDNLWLSYSRAEGMIAELKTKEEYESCDMRNPIKMYTDGLNTIKLDQQGIRYFVSTNSDHCNNGLKLHVDVLPTVDAMPSDFPKVITSESEALSFATAAGPSPSGSASVNCISTIFSVAANVMIFYILLFTLV